LSRKNIKKFKVDHNNGNVYNGTKFEWDKVEQYLEPILKNLPDKDPQKRAFIEQKIKRQQVIEIMDKVYTRMRNIYENLSDLLKKIECDCSIVHKKKIEEKYYECIGNLNLSHSDAVDIIMAEIYKHIERKKEENMIREEMIKYLELMDMPFDKYTKIIDTHIFYCYLNNRMTLQDRIKYVKNMTLGEYL